MSLDIEFARHDHVPLTLPPVIVEGPYRPLMQVKDAPPVETIRDRVAMRFGVAPKDICGQSRVKHLVIPRQAGMYLARKLTRRSLPEIGKRFGNRDHTTVMHAMKSFPQKMAEDHELETIVRELEASFSYRTRYSPNAPIVWPDQIGVAI